MGSDHRSQASHDVGPSADYSTFTSQAYAASNEEGLTQATKDWLEEQSLMPFIREVAARSLARLSLLAGEAVLEVGCGTGVFLPGLAGLVGSGGRVVGLDHSSEFLDAARGRLTALGLTDRVEFVEGDARHLPFDDNSFDAAHCERVLMHIEGPEQAIREMRRVVRPGGRLVVAEVFAAGATMEHPDVEASHLIEATMMSGLRNKYIGIQLRRLLIEAGFTGVDGEVVGYFETELDQEEAEEYGIVARALAEHGQLDRNRAESAITAMEERRANGTHCGLALIFVVFGQVPDSLEARPEA